MLLMATTFAGIIDALQLHRGRDDLNLTIELSGVTGDLVAAQEHARHGVNATRNMRI